MESIDGDSGAERSAWAAALEQIALAGDRIAAMMRERGESRGDADAWVALLGATMDAYLNQISAEPDFPTFVPCCGYFQHLGSPNPDTVYRRAVIDGSGTYRITGERRDARQVTIMPFAAPSASGMAGWPPFDLDDVATGPDGRFDVLLSPERPVDHQGEWWQLEPEMASLWLRTVSDDWGREQEPRVAIVRLDGPERRMPPSPASIDAKLATFGAIVEHTIAYGVRRVDELISEGIVNELTLVDYGANGGMPMQWYHEGAFDLDDGSSLLLEAALPPGCDYFSLSLTDRMFVTLDWVHAPTSLNSKQAGLDDDGKLRVIVSAADPGVRNWMDTTGYRRGVLQCRWIGSAVAPEVTLRLLRASELADALSLAGATPISPAARSKELTERSIGAQLRSLW